MRLQLILVTPLTFFQLTFAWPRVVLALVIFALARLGLADTVPEVVKDSNVKHKLLYYHHA